MAGKAINAIVTKKETTRRIDNYPRQRGAYVCIKTIKKANKE
jgi:hypothetical protein